MRSQTATLLQHATRRPAPFFHVHDHWLIRQLAPGVAKIELPRDEGKQRRRLALLEREAGKEWLVRAAEGMIECTRTDDKRWKKSVKEGG